MAKVAIMKPTKSPRDPDPRALRDISSFDMAVAFAANSELWKTLHSLASALIVNHLSTVP
jgi:hypothetical protein